MSSKPTDLVKSFVTNNDVMSLGEYTKSNIYHSSFCPDFVIGLINKNEYKAQIKFQSDLLDLCNQKIDQLVTENNAKEISSDVLEILSSRIHKMYKSWFEIFGIDAIMIKDFIEFGSKNKLIFTEFRKALDNLMECFQVDPDAYVTVARFMFDDLNDIPSARKYLENGLIHHNKQKKLFQETLYLEIDICLSTNEDSFSIVLKKYKQTIDQFKDDINLHFILVDHVLNILGVREFSNIVVRDMVNTYSSNELMWQKLAKIQLNGFIYNFDLESIDQSKDDLICISKCINTYEKALKKDWLPANQQNLWDFYMDNIIEINKSDKVKDKVVKNFVTKAIVRIFDKAHTHKQIHKADHFIFWAQNSSHDKEIMILKESVILIKNDPNLWFELLGFYLTHDYFEHGWATFQEGINALQEESMPLWDMMNLYLLNTNDVLIRNFYEEASFCKFKNISKEYKPNYLEWSFLRFGIDSARKLFPKLKELDTTFKELYTKMIYFECLSYFGDKYNLKCIRRLFNETCNLFGHNDIDLWTKRLQFEFTYGKKMSVEVTYLEALQMLEPDLKSAIVKVKDDFDIEYRDKFSSQISEIIDIND